jgi:hypothetical protein
VPFVALTKLSLVTLGQGGDEVCDMEPFLPVSVVKVSGHIRSLCWTWITVSNTLPMRLQQALLHSCGLGSFQVADLHSDTCCLPA